MTMENVRLSADNFEIVLKNAGNLEILKMISTTIIYVSMKQNFFTNNDVRFEIYEAIVHQSNCRPKSPTTKHLSYRQQRVYIEHQRDQ